MENISPQTTYENVWCVNVTKLKPSQLFVYIESYLRLNSNKILLYLSAFVPIITMFLELPFLLNRECSLH